MKKKMNNNGFSLVELIIVVAIMAILVGILAPQYIKYVEKSRVSSDKAMAQEIETALQVTIADEEAQDALVANSTVKNTKGDGKIVFDADVTAALKASGALDLDTTKKEYTFKSKDFVNSELTYTIAQNATTNLFEVQISGYPEGVK